ncbi:hypothetical protein BO78DRAFT_359822 [Aspergillus sclerotiicarbonarius CBS 121057]|uniref:F-box domain-containing protein n=1 Tax=Aspergillus sclerotiicarbonarius (strain CBS 121057 / IBT 28362) TaxID=1448318 RepID=A0A319F4T2_ASPSB|nr:hypothetical protein BO78DRAFT_359822 [Aspergillus sclerotiicarbonarius CBS 121057]
MAECHPNADVWRVIFEHSDYHELWNLCLVSREFNVIATPLLYRSIPLIAPEEPDFQARRWQKPEKKAPHPRGHRLLISRLQDQANDTLRAWIHEVIIAYPSVSIDHDSIRRLETDDFLAKLIACLPSLRRISIAVPSLQSDALIRTICDHSAKPELLLLNQDGKSETLTFADQTLPCVSTLSANVNTSDDSSGPNRRIPAIQQLFFNSPNLRSFSLEFHETYGGCVIRMPRHERINSFRFTGEEKFPPLKHLSLDGYRIDDGEWTYWRDGFQWEKLSSLSVGPDNTGDLLDRLAGYATSLTTLKVSAWADDSDPGVKRLEKLLWSFNSLETLEIKGFMCSIAAIANHGNLSTLCLHEEELVHSEHQRRVATAQELDHLDIHCPKLKSLAVCLNRRDNQWPEDVFNKLATRFKNLRNLSLHFGLGLGNINHPIKPTINYSSVRSIGEKYFDQRKHSGIDISDLFTLTIWTGKYFRRFPRWEPAYSRFEKQYTATYEIRLRNDEIHVRHLQKEKLDLVSSGKIKMSTWSYYGLPEQVKGAVEGPKDSERGFGRGFF